MAFRKITSLRVTGHEALHTKEKQPELFTAQSVYADAVPDSGF